MPTTPLVPRSSPFDPAPCRLQRPRPLTRLLTLCALAGSLTLSTTARADSPAPSNPGGLRHESALSVRATPVGLSLMSDTAYRVHLFDSESLLLQNTYLDAGVMTGLSPAFVWAGPYVEVVPVAVLKLRAAAQYVTYFGNLGFLYQPGDDDWSLERLTESADLGLGAAASGWMFEARVTPQVRVGSLVAFVDTRLTKLDVDLDTPYYEPYFDLLFAPEEFFWITRPTVGYLFGRNPAQTYLLLAARWERAVATGTDITRDTAGLVFVWKIPARWVSTGKPTLSGFGGVFVNHPNRNPDGLSPYFGTQLTVSFD